jgi:DNA-binding IclR family transcriptional regulator
MIFGMTGSSKALIGRAFRILNAFTEAGPELTLSELAQATGLPRSTVHRLARQLHAEGALERTRRGWRVGVRLFELGQLVPTQQGLRERALPHMNDLYEATHQTIHLAVLDGGDVLYVEVLSGHRKVRSPSRRGGRMPPHCTALGKVLLAFADDDLPREERPLERRTRRTIVDHAVLARTLDEVRRAAIAYDHEESLEGLCCVAAPVFGRKGRVVAALSVSMPVGHRLTPERAGPAVRIAARALSRELSSGVG